jgi:hypothetical protein
MHEDCLPKRIRKELRRLADLAYGRELDQKLRCLADDFDLWRRKELSPWELSEQIHTFHQGPARQLFIFYRDAGESMAIGRALVDGLLRRDEVPDEVFPHVSSAVKFYSEDQCAVADPEKDPIGRG